MTLQWKICWWLYRKTPRDWMVAWCVEYARSICAQFVHNNHEAHFTIVPHKAITVVVDGDDKPMTLTHQDTIVVQVEKQSKRIFIDVSQPVSH